MIASAAAGAHRVRRALRWRPEWWVAVIAALAWAALAFGHGSGPSLAGAQTFPGSAAAGSVAPGTILPALAEWTLMVGAMMLPVALPATRHVALNSLRRRRARAMVLFLAAYVAVWVAVGAAAVTAVELAIGAGVAPPALAGGGLLVAAGWQLTRVKRRALVGCRRTVPLPPVGWRADAGCVRFGVQQAARCVRSCWALMLAMAALGHASLAWMALATGIVIVEELVPRGWRYRSESAVLLALGAGLAVLGA